MKIFKSEKPSLSSIFIARDLRLYDRYKLLMMQTFDIMKTQISNYQFIKKDVTDVHTLHRHT